MFKQKLFRYSITILFGREVLPVCPSIVISFSAYSNLITSERKSKLTVKSIVRILLNNNTPIAAETFRKANRIDCCSQYYCDRRIIYIIYTCRNNLRTLTILYSSNRSKFRHSNTNEFLVNYSQNPEQKFGCTICRKSRTSRVHILYSRVDLACQYGR